MKVFISYAHADRRVVETVAKRLVAAGHTAWVDVEGIRAGESWRSRIVASIEAADAMVVFISPSSATSRQVATEVHLASEAGMPIFPVLIEGAQPSDEILYDIAGLQLIDLTAQPKLGTAALIKGLDSIVADPNEIANHPAPPPRHGPSQRRSWWWIAAAASAMSAVVVGGAWLRAGGGSSDDPTTTDVSEFSRTVDVPPMSEFVAEKTVSRACGGGVVDFSAGPVDSADPDLFRLEFEVVHEGVQTEHIFAALTAVDDSGVPYQLAGDFVSEWRLQQAPERHRGEIVTNKDSAAHRDADGIVLVVEEVEGNCGDPILIPLLLSPG